MSGHQNADSQQIHSFKQVELLKDKFFLKAPQLAAGGIILGSLVGVGVFCAGIYSGHETRTWGSFLFNLIFFFSISLGGVAFGNMQDVIGAKWGRPIKRIHESFGSFIPFAVISFLFFLLALKLDLGGAANLYKWIVEPEFLEHFPGKQDWLRLDFMLFRVVLALVVLSGLVAWHMKLTLGPDFLFLKGQKDEALKQAEANRATLRYWSAPVMFTYSLCFSIITFDLTMSLAATWFSTLWAGWAFSIMMQTLMASLLIFMFYLKSIGHPISQVYGQKQFHDVGKLLHGFTVFFAYLTFAHVLTYWYTNVPEETSYFIDRLKEPWFYLVVINPFFTFLIPFVLLIFKANKWTPSVTLPICFIVLCAQWTTNFLVVIPETTNTMGFPWIELGLFAGFLSAFLGCLFAFTSRVPMVSLADPLLREALEEAH